MPNFTPLDTHERHQFLARTFVEAEAILANPDFRAVAGEDLSEAHSRWIGRLFVPSVRNGVVRLPKSVIDTDMVPIVAMQPGETLAHGSDFTPTPQQRMALDGILAARSRILPTDTIRQAVVAGRFNFGPAKVTARNPEIALVSNPIEEHPIGTNGSVYLQGRPLMVLGMSEGLEYGAFQHLVHEFEHLEQAFKHPLMSTNPHDLTMQLVRDELGAYAPMATSEEGLLRIGHVNIADTEDPTRYTYDSSLGRRVPIGMFINGLRLTANQDREDKMYPDPAVLSGLDHISISA